MTHRRKFAVPVLGAALLLGACGGTTSASPPATGSASTTIKGAVDPNAAEAPAPGDIPDNQAFVAYTPPAGGFTVKVPEGWARTETGGGATFTDKLNSIHVESIPMAKPPTIASTTADVLPVLAKQAGYKAGKVSSAKRTAGDTIVATYQTDSAPDAVTGKARPLAVERYEFWRGGTSVVLTLSGGVGADNLDPWRTVTDGFGWK